GGDDPGHLHGLDHARGAVVADLQLALHGGNGSAPAFGDETYRLVVQRILLATLAPFAAALETAGTPFISAGKDVLNVIGRAALLPGFDHAVHLVIGHEGAVHAHRQAGARR